jgi:DNA-binding transcriptional ArsR family regulator
VTEPIKIVDPKLAKAFAHPLRIQILSLLDNRVASPSEIATELGTDLSNTSYHVRQLATLGYVELVERKPRRSSVESYYTAALRPTVTDEAWAKLPPSVKRPLMAGWIQRDIDQIVAAAEYGGFDRGDMHQSLSAGPVDLEAWQAISRELADALQRIEALLEEGRSRLAEDPGAEALNGRVLMMLFEGPEPALAPAQNP